MPTDRGITDEQLILNLHICHTKPAECDLQWILVQTKLAEARITELSNRDANQMAIINRQIDVTGDYAKEAARLKGEVVRAELETRRKTAREIMEIIEGFALETGRGGVIHVQKLLIRIRRRFLEEQA